MASERTARVQGPTYEGDSMLWAQEQGRALRERRWEALDVEGLAVELDDVASQVQRELTSRLAVVLMHQLKQEYQPGRRSRSWAQSVRREALEVVELVTDLPSLRQSVNDAVSRAYRRARARAAAETNVPLNVFPKMLDEPARARLREALLDAEEALELPVEERWVSRVL